ncbi:Gp63 major surface glycoprotein-like protein [Trypanosoma brucei gambiense DAL972]|uniref:Leishmanolysin-like peptidase n=1 Tax=Trypanosoma brucei gambiense (strain MHOM/CI/86/DAL972) TaxID=679716 RepID=D0A7S8_TRYB9|nr:Gp63 major surface glycoprotein-like protein [Trypanosoma brucei gambiense DAL972]CBH17729.1 Gp63 major surface glycoprotein-like protein [Trypanosoma brucei gambiense DAL972]|eukprot:XP_011779993.1 Gp63 major surface glycoprotein-like protein [Trypanosoma brucei gambiense DAL972]
MLHHKLDTVSVIALLLTLRGTAADDNITGEEEGTGHRCMHNDVAVPYDELPSMDVVHDLQTAHVAEVSNNTEGEGNKSKSVERKNVRFHIKYALGETCKGIGMTVPTYIKGTTKECTEDDVLTKWKLRSVKVMMEAATKFLSSALLVDPLEAVNVPGGKCSGVQVPKMTVPNADYVVFVTINPRPEEETTTVAWAAACRKDTRSGRPVVGHINFIPAAIQRNPSSLAEHVAMHELAHAIGFSDIAETMLRAPNGLGAKGSQRVYRKGLGKAVTLITSPKVLKVAREYYGCPGLDGVEVEDAGSEGTRGSHWKKRILFNEALVGSVTSGQLFFSPLTLAYFEDLGFYTANYSTAETGMTWGKGRGCDFLYQKCDSHPREWGEFCFRKEMFVSTCTLDRSSLGACDITTHPEDLPQLYRYFDDPRVGGSSAEMDYCPTVMGFVNAYCTAELGFAFMNVFGNEMGVHSLCYDSDVITSVFPNFPFAARCFPTTCTPSGQLLLRVQGRTVACPRDGKAGLGDTSKLKGVHGKVQCPPSENFCKNSGNGISKLQLASVADEVDGSSNTERIGHSLISPTPHTWNSEDMGSCSSRLACLKDIPPPFPACSLAARKVKECLGNDCPGSAQQWRYANEVGNSCLNPEGMVAMCMDGWRGVNELCGAVDPESKLGRSYRSMLPF